MPPIRRSNLGRRTRRAIISQKVRNNQTEEERAQQNKWRRAHIAKLRAARSTPKIRQKNTRRRGKMKFPPPEPLYSLLYGNTIQSKHALSNTQKYNGCFQITSFGAEVVDQPGYNPSYKVPTEMDQNFNTFIKQEILNGDEDSFRTVPFPQSNISVKNEPISDELCSFITIKNEPLPEETSIEGCLSVKTKNQLEDQLAVPAYNFEIYELETPPLKPTQILQNKQLSETSQFIPPIRTTNAAHVTKTQS